MCFEVLPDEGSNNENAPPYVYDGSNNRNGLPYIHLATNNYDAVMAEGGRCVYCLGTIEAGTACSYMEIRGTGEFTVLCPLCAADAVVPLTKVPNENTLLDWHEQGFGT